MSTGYKSVYEALSRFASSLPVGQKTNAAVIGRLMNNIKLGYYPTDPDNIDLLLRGIKFPEGVTTNLLDPCCGCGKALRQLAQGNNCYAYGVELDESRAEEAQTRLHRVGFGTSFIAASAGKPSIYCFLTRRISRSSMRAADAPGMKSAS